MGKGKCSASLNRTDTRTELEETVAGRIASKRTNFNIAYMNANGWQTNTLGFLRSYKDYHTYSTLPNDFLFYLKQTHYSYAQPWCLYD